MKNEVMMRSNRCDTMQQNGNQHIVDLCDAELDRRKPIRVRRSRSTLETRDGYYVSEFHFVCPNERGVTKNPDGTVSTGIWVVAEENAIAGEKYGSVVALHSSRSEPSYLQGIIKGSEKRPRERQYAKDQTVKTKFGIEFLIQPTKNSLPWSGDATGEKGYAWLPLPQNIK